MTAAEVIASHWPNLTGSCTCGTPADTRRLHAAHQLDALKAAGWVVVELPKPVTIPAGWRGENCLGAWQGPDCEDPVSAWRHGRYDPDAIAMPGGDFISVDDARALAAALLAAADAAEATDA